MRESELVFSSVGAFAEQASQNVLRGNRVFGGARAVPRSELGK